jgi:hypothetical protein
MTQLHLPFQDSCINPETFISNNAKPKETYSLPKRKFENEDLCETWDYYKRARVDISGRPIIEFPSSDEDTVDWGSDYENQ